MFQVDDIVQDRFKILQQVGRGSQAIVYKAADIKSNALFAIKQYLYVDALMEQDRQQIEMEAEILRKTHHRNVVHCYELIKTPDQYLIIMEFIDGVSLSSFIEKQFPHLVPLEQYVDFQLLCKEVKANKESNDLRYFYQSLVRKMLKDKLQQRKQTNILTLASGFTLNPELKGTFAATAESGSDQAPRRKPDEQHAQPCVKQSLLVSYEPLGNQQNTIQVQRQPGSTRGSVKGSLAFLEDSTPAAVKQPPYQDTIEALFAQLLEVLIVLQDLQLMHRDLKPENLMVTRAMELKLIDFGFVKSCKQGAQGASLVGTPGFMAPEVFVTPFGERSYNTKVDIWSSGSIFYQLLYGYCPFLLTRFGELELLQAQYGLYLPTDLFGVIYKDTRFIDVIEACFTVDPSKRPDAYALRSLFYRKMSVKPIAVPNARSCRERVQKVVCLGDFGVGKTTLLCRMAGASQMQGQKICVQRIITQHTADNHTQKANVIAELYDTLGTERRGNSIVPSLVRQAHVVFLVYRPDVPESVASLNGWLQFARAGAHEKHRCYLIRNSFDNIQCSSEAEPEVTDELTLLQRFDVDQSTDLPALLQRCMEEAAADGAIDVVTSVLVPQEHAEKCKCLGGK